MKIDASGSSTSGSMTATITPTLSGLTTSKPRVCLTPETFALNSLLYFVLTWLMKMPSITSGYALSQPPNIST